MFPTRRMRRLRRTGRLRDMVAETRLTVDDLIYPIFIDETLKSKQPISTMPGQFRLAPGDVRAEARELVELGIPAVILFGIPKTKDEVGSSAFDESGVVQTAIREIKDEVGDDLVIITDVCMCEYTSHGHCGVLMENGSVDNDATLELLAKEAVSHASAGVDMVAPSDMMDGRVGAIRQALDNSGFTGVPIMAYAAKYASSFFGPFRDAAYSSPSTGDRRGYQMDMRNSDEALHETYLDIEEGADIVMVKPAMPYLDIIRRVKEEFQMPTAAYQVSGEYSMIKAAAEKEYLNEQSVVLESLTSIKRAGADLILTYFAKDAAKWL
ncbi:MAG TPA: porphobilinogen synthase [Euryarchaeota archaeon]|nr:porphobilinogen synthase [Euryarchaeota archaeon]HDY74855.1 porphobilinogen synthase [Euryarchaeota archaeon]